MRTDLISELRYLGRDMARGARPVFGLPEAAVRAVGAQAAFKVAAKVAAANGADVIVPLPGTGKSLRVGPQSTRRPTGMATVSKRVSVLPAAIHDVPAVPQGAAPATSAAAITARMAASNKRGFEFQASVAAALKARQMNATRGPRDVGAASLGKGLAAKGQRLLAADAARSLAARKAQRIATMTATQGAQHAKSFAQGVLPARGGLGYTFG